MVADSDLWSLWDISQHFNLCADWIRSEAQAGRLPHLKAGRRLLFSRSAVEKALAERAAQYPTPAEAAHAVR